MRAALPPAHTLTSPGLLKRNHKQYVIHRNQTQDQIQMIIGDQESSVKSLLNGLSGMKTPPSRWGIRIPRPWHGMLVWGTSEVASAKHALSQERVLLNAQPGFFTAFRMKFTLLSFSHRDTYGMSEVKGNEESLSYFQYSYFLIFGIHIGTDFMYFS